MAENLLGLRGGGGNSVQRLRGNSIGGLSKNLELEP